MDAKKVEIRHLERRMAESLAMAAAAAGPCAQIAHMALARLYGNVIAAFVAEADGHMFHTLFVTATGRGEPVSPLYTEPLRTLPAIRAMVSQKRQLAATLLS